MDVVGGLLPGVSGGLQPANLFWCFLGCFLGTVVGILPGLGPAATIAMLLPLTYKMDPAGGIIMMAGLYSGAKHGGDTPPRLAQRRPLRRHRLEPDRAAGRGFCAVVLVARIFCADVPWPRSGGAALG